MKRENILIAIMSYNRGDHLENCVTSVANNISSNILVLDDASTCPKTKTKLSEIAKKYEVIINKKKNENRRLKGLYYNMNKALDYAIHRRYLYILFIQDDMQIIRKIYL